jgi:hypothetical protein
LKRILPDYQCRGRIIFHGAGQDIMVILLVIALLPLR